MHTVPVCGQAFFDRTEYLNRIMQRAFDLKAGYRQNLALVGPPLIGKSSILLRSVELLQRYSPLLPVYLELRPDGSVAEFVEQFAATLLYRYWAIDGRQAPQTFEALYDLCHPSLPKTTTWLAQAVAKGRRGQASALRLLFEAPGVLRQESGRLCIIMLDEFHRLAAWERAGSLDALGRQIVVQQETMYLFASSAEPEARRILQERLALLFGHFEVMAVGPFDLATSVRFLSDHARLGALGIPTLIVLADLTEGHPFALDAVARALAAAGAESSAATALGPAAEAPARLPIEQVCEALETVLWQPSGVLAQQSRQALERLPMRRRAVGLPVLLAIAGGAHRIETIAEVLDRPRSQTARAVKALAEAGVVTRHGAFCRLTSRLLRFWLTSAYRIQHGSVHLDARAARQALRVEVERLVDQATTRAPQTVLETVEALLRRFRDDLVELHGRRVRLPTLDVHTLLLPGLPRALVGRRDHALWFCVPYSAVVRESDAVTLVQTLRSVPKPWSRRIVIALAGLEVNAKLFLQEQRFWVWELAEVNQLLELYGLPRLLPTELQAVASVSAVLAEPVAEPLSESEQASA